MNPIKCKQIYNDRKQVSGFLEMGREENEAQGNFGVIGMLGFFGSW